jgi:hypothetical protein
VATRLAGSSSGDDGNTLCAAANQSNDALIGSGSTSGVEYSTGDIDDVAFYPNVLTKAQVSQLHGADDHEHAVEDQDQDRHIERTLVPPNAADNSLQEIGDTTARKSPRQPRPSTAM